MDNFDLTKFLAEGKLHEAELRPLSDEQLESVAQSIADELTYAERASKGGLDLQYIVTPNSVENDTNDTPRGGGFDLDVEAGRNTPDGNWRDENGFDISNYLGAYAGGSYVIRPNPDKSDEYLVTNAAMRNAKVARVYFEGDTLKFEMLSEDESIPRSSDEVEAQRKKEREMANVFVREEKKSNKMKVSELKQLIEQLRKPESMRASDKDWEKFQNYINGLEGVTPKEKKELLNKPGKDLDIYIKQFNQNNFEKEDVERLLKKNKMKVSELKEMIKAAMLNEIEIEEADRVAYVAERPGSAYSEKYFESFEDAKKFVDETDPEGMMNWNIRKIEGSDDKELERAMDAGPGEGGVMEAKKDKDEDKKEEDDVEVELEDEDVEMEPETSDKGLTGAKKIVDDSLEAALEAARELGDEKLVVQIGNTIKFFTSSQIVGDSNKNFSEETLQEVKRMQRIAGIIK